MGDHILRPRHIVCPCHILSIGNTLNTSELVTSGVELGPPHGLDWFRNALPYSLYLFYNLFYKYALLMVHIHLPCSSLGRFLQLPSLIDNIRRHSVERRNYLSLHELLVMSETTQCVHPNKFRLQVMDWVALYG